MRCVIEQAEENENLSGTDGKTVEEYFRFISFHLRMAVVAELLKGQFALQ